MMKLLLLNSLLVLANPQIYSDSLSPNFEQEVINAYVYGFPLVLMDVTKNMMTATSRVTSTKAPINQFLIKKTDSNQENTLYAQAWIDLTAQPIILSVPEMGDHHYFFPMLGAWTNVFFSLGTRTTGNRSNNFVLVGPDWKGTLPDGLKEIKSPTNTVLIIGKIRTKKSEDFPAIKRLQQEFRLKPLNATSTSTPSDSPPPAIESKLSPLAQVFDMKGIVFFTRLAELLKKNPVPLQDVDYVKKFSAFGLNLGEPFKSENFSTDVIEKIDRSVKEAQANIRRDWNRHPLATTVNDWGVFKHIGNYGKNYSLRAAFAYGGILDDHSDEALYPVTNLDSKGRLLDGNNKYTIHFDKDQVPPVKGYWSITLYSSEELFLSLPIEEHAIGSHDKLKFNKDGSLDIYIQNESPGDELEVNWLPAPKAEFTLILKYNEPEDSILKGNWNPPSIEKVEKKVEEK